MKNIAILCSGGDVSGMNAALKRFVEYSFDKGLTPYFVELCVNLRWDEFSDTSEGCQSRQIIRVSGRFSCILTADSTDGLVGVNPWGYSLKCMCAVAVLGVYSAP